MNYIILAAGKGTRLYPLTLTYPKCLYKLDEKTTVIKRMVSMIRNYDNNASVIVATGFMEDEVKKNLGETATYIFNPFYGITNSIASLWFAKDYLQDEVTIINADIVMSERATEEMLCRTTEHPKIFLDSSIKSDGDYNVQVNDDKVVVMSKNLSEYYGEYAGVTKLDKASSSLLRDVLEEMIHEGQINEWYEDVIVRMIFRNNYEFGFSDMAEYEWTEIDNVDDLVKAKKIHGSFTIK